MLATFLIGVATLIVYLHLYWNYSLRVATPMGFLTFRIRVVTLIDFRLFSDQGRYPNRRIVFWIRVAYLFTFSRKKKNLHFYSCFCGFALSFFGGRNQGGYPNQNEFLKKSDQGGHPNAKIRKTSREMQSIASTRNVSCIRVGTLIYSD